MMKNRLKKHSKTLRFLASCDKKVANNIIKHGDTDLINCMSDVCHNILKGNVRLSTPQKQLLQKYKQKIRKIAGKKTTTKAKKTLLQSGGFLGALLAPLIGGVLGPLLFPNKK